MIERKQEEERERESIKREREGEWRDVGDRVMNVDAGGVNVHMPRMGEM
jgi:hypothetical protein